MSTITKTLAALPTPPSRADIANFDTRADEFLAALPAMAADINTVTGQVNTVAGEVNAANVAAQTAKTSAQSAQAAAQAIVGASAWSSVTEYTVGRVVFGSNGHSYRAIVSNTNVNPVTDTSGKWLRLTLGLGTTASDAFPGDKGQLADTHRQSPHAPSNAQRNSDITKAEIEAKLTGTITSHNHGALNYLPLSGGAVTGAATFSGGVKISSNGPLLGLWDVDNAIGQYLYMYNGSIGFLNSSSQWILRGSNAREVQIYGALSIGETGCYITTTGDMYMPWAGSALSTILTNRLTKDMGHNNVGSLCFARYTGGGTISPGEAATGSALSPSNASGECSGSLSGTWRCLGYSPNYYSTLWQRVT